MKKKEVNNLILEMAFPILEPLGFKKKRNSDGWILRKDTDFGFNEVSLLVWQYGELFYISLVCIIRISSLNKVFLPYSSYVVHEDDQTMTIGAGINTFGYEGDHKIMVKTQEELIAAIIVLKDILINKGLPFFGKYQTVKSIDEEFNKTDRLMNLYADDLLHRPVIGITAAALNHNAKFEFWVSYYRDMIKNDFEHRKQKYEALVNYLRKEVLHT